MLHHSDLHSKINVSSAEMQKDSGSGHDTLHYSDLYSDESVNSAEIPTKAGHGHIALHHSHLYSNKNVPPAEMQMDRGGGDICYPEQGDEFVDLAAECSESSSETKGAAQANTPYLIRMKNCLNITRINLKTCLWAESIYILLASLLYRTIT